MGEQKIDALNYIQSELFSEIESLSQIDQVKYLNAIEHFVNDLYNSSLDIIIPLNEKYTKYARKAFCKNNNKHLNNQRNSNNANIITHNLYKIIKRYIYLQANKSIPYRDTLNSIYASDNYQKYYNVPLGYLNISSTMLYGLMNIGCYKIGDLLKYTEIELKRMFDYGTVSNLLSELDSLGLTFAEYLTQQQRASIIKQANQDTILNSSSNWVKVTDYNIGKKQNLYRNCKTINELIEMISIPNIEVPNDLLIAMKALGLNFPIIDHRINNQGVNVTNYLEYNVFNLPIQTRTKNALYRNGIHDVQTLITYSKEDLLLLKNINIVGVEEIENALKSFNLSLKEDSIHIKHKSV